MVYLCRIFSYRRQQRVSLTPLNGSEKTFSVDFKELEEFLRKHPVCLFPLNDETYESLSNYPQIIDENFLKRFLIHPAGKEADERINEYIQFLSSFPASLTEILPHFFEEKEGLGRFLHMGLSNGANDSRWEDEVCSNLMKVKSIDHKGADIDLIKTVRMVFSEGGLLEDILESYEYRQEQFMTALEIAESIEEKQGIMIEAGTGTGKSLAYLIPSAYHSISEGEQIVVSTRTRMLQDQLARKDVAIIKKLPNLEELRVWTLKGRERYFCLKKYFEELEYAVASGKSKDRTELFGVLLWSIKTSSGDLDELYLKEENRSKFTATRFECIKRLCPFFNRCPYYNSRDNAHNADIVITNHSLLFSEAHIRLEDSREDEDEPIGTLLPNFKVLIVDEAHELEMSLTEAMSFNLVPHEAVSTIRKAINSSKDALRSVRNHFDRSFLEELWGHLRKFTAEIEKILKTIVVSYNNCSTDEKRSIDNEELETLKKDIGELYTIVKRFRAVLIQLLRMVEDVAEEDETPILEKLNMELKSVISELDGLIRQLFGLSREEDGRVVYVRRAITNNGNHLIITSAPIKNDQLMAAIFPDVPVKVFISATLWVYSGRSDGFNYARRILGLNDSFHAIKLGSSFDFQEQLKFYIVKDMAKYQPNNREYLNQGAHLISEMLKLVKGSAMVLFTSYKDMHYVISRISGELQNIQLQIQEPSNSPTAIVNEHVNSTNSVIFGVRSFWEGIDLPGEHLKLLIIFKLPFERPDDPLINARIKHYGTRNYVEGLNKYYYPKMITAFRQGIGRLIRTRNDRGVLVVLDNRIVDGNKIYSRKLLRSLSPDVKINVIDSSKVISELRKLRRRKWF